MSFDDRTQKCLDSLHPKARPKFESFIVEAQALAASKGLQYTAICGTRSWEQQAALFAQGRTKPGKIVTNAKPGSSFHNFGLAIDCGVFQAGEYVDESCPHIADKIHKLMAPLAEKNGLRWGGNFKSIVDTPHFELDTARTLTEMRDLHDRGKDALA